MLEKKSPVKLSPLMTGMLDGAIHPIKPNPITFRSLLSQSLSKHVNFPPEACATSLSGFLAATGDFRNPEERFSFFGEDKVVVPNPTTVEEAVAIVAAAIFLCVCVCECVCDWAQADTGSDLTWINCRYRCRGRRCSGDSTHRRVFRADRSSSFATVPCSSAICKIDLANLFSLASCPSPLDPCTYDYRYSDGSATLGLFANETVTFSLTNGRKKRLHNVLVGCSESSRGQSFQAADGVMGLGYSNYSFALKTAHKFGGKFSYCLVDHLSPKNVSSYLIFGSHQQVNISLIRMRYTELVLGVINPFYAVNIKGISIGGSMLEIPAETWNLNGTGGAIVDSGTSLTVLTQPAYDPVMAALNGSLHGFQRLDLGIGPLEYCFNSTGFNESLVARLEFHFVDGARFEPPVKSYVIDAAPGVKCLGFAPAAWPGASVIGNIMQQNHFWEFDIANSRLGFATSSCT